MSPLITANLQPCNANLAAHASERCGDSFIFMRPEQRPIATWIKSTLQAKGWTPYRWAKATGGKVNATTITRAMSDAYTSVTSLRIVADLAEAAGVDMPSLSSSTDHLFNEAMLCELLPVVLAAMGYPQPARDDLLLGARLLQDGIEFVQANPEVAADPVRARFAMLALAGIGARQAS